MATVGFTGISSLRLAAKCSDAGLHIGKGGGHFRELKIGIFHLLLDSGLARLATLLFVCSDEFLAVFFS